MPSDPHLAAAYAYCRAIAKREAKNFYYGFMALPRPKSDAMCAVYAFMRRADDISDDESFSLDERRAMMTRWLASWRAFSGRVQGDGCYVSLLEARDRNVFEAVRDVQQCFGISDDLLELLVQGTTMDLEPEPPAGVARLQKNGRSIDQYETVEALEHYCYLVASVVGLVTIRIFGVTDPRADGYAEQMGLAFQLTNILRDVKEDAERGRVYLPLDLLSKRGCSTENVLAASASGVASPALTAVLQELAMRAEGYYAVRKDLVPMLSRDSRPAMRVLISIYHLLLIKMRRRHYRVFRERISVSTTRKLLVLFRGLLGGMLSRGGAGA